MDLEDVLQETTKELLDKLGIEYTEIDINEEDKDSYNINIKSENSSILIGHHGNNIFALQHLLKVLAWKKINNEHFNILLDVDDYRKRQEENVLSLAERKIENIRRTGQPESMPPMCPYFRRKIHMLCMSAGYNDIETISEGEGDRRHLILKLK